MRKQSGDGRWARGKRENFCALQMPLLAQEITIIMVTNIITKQTTSSPPDELQLTGMHGLRECLCERR